MSAWLAAVLSSVVVAPGAASENARADLVAAALASPRPAACGRFSESLQGQPSWARTRDPELDNYCALLAAGYASLVERDGARALQLANAAHQLFPARVEAQVLEARAQLSLNHIQAAWLGFNQAKLADPRSLGAPAVLHDYAVASAVTEHLADAFTTYRQLASRVTLLSDELRAARIYIEAGVVAMQTGPAGLDEALGYLDEARHGSPLLGNWARVCLALVLDRQGREEQARGVLAEIDVPAELYNWSGQTSADAPDSPLWQQLGPHLPFLPTAELQALLALLHEATEPQAGLEHWQLYLQGRALPVAWRAHAEAKIAALRRRSRP